ncbi:MAG: 4-oxalocrotonate decarboxylase [Alphaproteobacteria bacterium]|nr:4-oxalocrotonate decarboxylase [Alphaproteobacteria bacterium]
MDVAKHARALDEAMTSGIPLPQLSAGEAVTLVDAYRIQMALVEHRLNRQDERSGIKLGLTSRAKAAQMGIAEPIYGRLTDGMLIDDGGEITLSAYIQPRVEPEIAFLLKAPLGGPISVAQAMAAVEAIAPAIEVIDSRYRDFKFTLADVVADNCSAAGYLLGPWHRPDIDISNLGMVLEIDGRPVQIGSSAAILGHPARSLVQAARLAALAGDRIQAGYIVMAGSATAAEPLKVGAAVSLSVETIGRVGFRVAMDQQQQ